MSKPYFQSGATTYTFDYAEVLPFDSEDVPNQTIGRTQTGGKKVVRLGAHYRSWHLRWRCTSAGSLANLQSFVRNTVQFAATAFTYVDSAGNSVTVRIMDPRVGYRTVVPGVYEGSFQLEEEI